jgi:HEAT repeat protein
MRALRLSLLLSLAAPLAATPSPSSAAPPDAAQPDLAEVERQADGLLSSIDVPATPERWRALGPAAVPKLVALARDPRALPSRRAGALEGLASIGGDEARAALLEAATDEAAPWTVRASGLSGAGRLLPPTELLAALRPVLERAGTPVVRAYAGRVLAERTGAPGCAATRAQAGREAPGNRLHFDRALERCR